ncbi:DUF4136 domain-containing protein [Alteraurantiacibacter aquimixticola]|uniref:DUF4136 domain-containing protein n=1 Tax=Alteraurantiacibacter aquimixticola TaxID=2489173 RepID=A0A4T3F5V9_9SPHN|nr:DUF4136 domain-containing protein [Alteraurantiacibacter aquimixticola]TIX51022.1 DUF4136 domain-containing protein [Alteraurantiacibacter aquimixticola]
MRGFRHLAIAALAVTGLAACATPAWVSPVEVTRFTGATPAELVQGTIAIQPATGLDPQSIEFGLYRTELAEELTALGYSVVDGASRQLAVLDITESVSQPDRRGGPVSVGGGASTGSYGSGVGLGVGIDLSGRPAEEIARTVAVYIRPAEGGGNLWEGRASFTATANSDYADPALAAARAIEALFTGFPGRSGETIEVE